MRVKSHWFKTERTKSPQEIAGAAAFIVWRVSQNALKTMRAARFELPAGRVFRFPRRVAHVSDARRRPDRVPSRRRALAGAFTTALANRVGEILAENESDLLGAAGRSDIKARFVDQVNAAAAECAGFEWNDDGPDYGFLRYVGHRVADVMAPEDRTWAISQVIEVQAPEAAETLVRAMAGLLDLTPRSSRRGAHASAGE